MRVWTLREEMFKCQNPLGVPRRDPGDLQCALHHQNPRADLRGHDVFTEQKFEYMLPCRSCQQPFSWMFSKSYYSLIPHTKWYGWVSFKRF